MKAPAFAYRRPDTLDEALALLSEHRGEAQILAGGQSLLATLAMRLSSPAVLIDINRIVALRGIARGDAIRIGALARHVEVLESAVIAKEVPLLAMALPHVAHAAVRNRGTTCGSLALADPAAEMPAVAVALDAKIVLRKQGRDRIVAARDFFTGLYETAREDDEIIVEVHFPKANSSDVYGFAELSRRHGDFATVGVAARATHTGDRLHNLDLVVFGSEPMPKINAAARGIIVTPATPARERAEIAQTIVSELQPMDSHQGRGETKRKQAAVLVRRMLADMQQRAFGSAA
jgi:carbon-monoxide dehydrogenase medium subunit